MVDIFRPEVPLDTRTEQARRAVKTFRQMQPQLTAYARALTQRKDVRVELQSQAIAQASTDGKKIYYVPPIGLGEVRQHNRALCDKRGDNLKQRCPACAMREGIMAAIFHEIAHIAFDTFTPVSEQTKVDLLLRALDEGGSAFAKAVERRVQEAPIWIKNSHQGMIGLISEFLPMIFNGLEDARVNREMFRARPGTKSMFEAMAFDVFENGVEQKNARGENVRVAWRDYPTNLQIIVGCYCKLSGYEIKGWFHPQVEQDLGHPALLSVLDKMSRIHNPAGVYELSFEVLDELRKLGYCKSKFDPESEPEPEEEQGEEGSESDEEQSSPESEQQQQDPSEGNRRDEASEDSDSEGSMSDDQPSEQGDGDSSNESGDASDETERSPGELEGEEDSADPVHRGGDSEGSGEDPSSDGEGGSAAPEESSPDGTDDEADRGGDASASDGSESDDGPDEYDDRSREGSSEANTEGADTDYGPDSSGSGGAGEPGAESSEGDADGAGGVLPPSRDADGEAGSQAPGSQDGGTESDSEPSKIDPRDTQAGSESDLRSDEREGSDSSANSSDPRTPLDSAELSVGPIGTDDDNLATEAPLSEQGLTDDEDTAGREAESDSGGGESLRSDGEQLASGGESDADTESTEEAVESSDQSNSGYPESNDSLPPQDDGYGEDHSSDERSAPEEDEEAEPIDTGADQGEGGIEVDEVPDPGTPEEVATKLADWLGHPELTPAQRAQLEADVRDVQAAIIQGHYFETPSVYVDGVWECKYNDPPTRGKDHTVWSGYHHSGTTNRRVSGVDADVDPPETILAPALMRMRVAFADNQRAQDLRNLKAGRVDGRVLGKRVFHDDPRLFKRRFIPGKKDYFVVIGMDVSGSTTGVNLVLMKRSVMAQANLLARMGIKFAVYAHSATGSIYGNGWDLDIYEVKSPYEQWTDRIKNRLREIGPGSGNLDGHALEYLRKVVDSQQATDRIILYYSDGKMPALNYDEELVILQREIRHCRKVGYTLLGVGIRTDSPERHGLDTVQVNEDADIVKVVRHIERRLLGV